MGRVPNLGQMGVGWAVGSRLKTQAAFGLAVPNEVRDYGSCMPPE